MQNKIEKKGLFKLLRGKQSKKSSCCGSFEVEEIPEEEIKKTTKSSCCGGFEIEEIPEEEIKKVTKSSCCGSFEVEEVQDESGSDKDKKA
jgi:hypothetical protein